MKGTKDATSILQKYADPRVDSPTREVELAVKSAREDVCLNIWTAATLMMLAGQHWVAFSICVVLTLGQCVVATVAEQRLRAERWKNETASSFTSVDK